MIIHFLIHEKAEMPGAILIWAENKGFSATFTYLFKNQILPGTDDFDFLVVMGGPMNIYEEEKYPWLKEEKLFIKNTIDKGKKVLGICLGAQLLANVLGAKVYKNEYTEIGWFPVQHTKEGENSKLVGGLVFPCPVLHWHGDTFDIPTGAFHLLKSVACLNQAFSVGNNVLALQFHFEMIPESLKKMTNLDRKSLVKNSWVMNETEILEGEKYLDQNNQILYTLLDRFFEF